MIFAIPSNTQAASFNRRKAKADSLAQGSRVYVRNAILVTHSAIREVEALARNIAIRVRRIVCSEPGEGQLSGGQSRWTIRHGPCLDKNLLGSIRGAGGGGGTDVGGQFLEPMVRSQGHPPKRTRRMNRLLARGHGRPTSEHGLVIRGGAAQVHGDVFGLAGRGVNAVGVAGVRGGGDAGLADMAGTKRTLESRVGYVVVWGLQM